MRITTKLSTAGSSSGYLSMPSLPYPADDYVILGSEGQRMDEERVRQDLARSPGISMSSDDDLGVITFAVELLDRMRVSLNSLMAKDPGVKKTSSDSPKTRAQKRFDRGQVAFVRVDIRRAGGKGYKVFLSATDPLGVVGHAREFAEIYAQAFADNIIAIVDELQPTGTAVTLIEREGCEGVFDYARRRNDFMVMKHRHANCPNRYGCQCSPAQPTCELFNQKTGRCRFCDSIDKEDKNAET